MTGREKLVKLYRDHKVDDREIWLMLEFGVFRYSSPEVCQWCGNRVQDLYRVPGITPDGRMNDICFSCACGKYGDRIEKEMEP